MKRLRLRSHSLRSMVLQWQPLNRSMIHHHWILAVSNLLQLLQKFELQMFFGRIWHLVARDEKKKP